MIRTLDEDFRTGYKPDTYRDIDDIHGVFVVPPRHALFVAVDPDSGDVLGTCGVRDGVLRGGPEHLVRRYAASDTAQLVRVYVRHEDRRRGIARALVRTALEFILADDGYSIIALHTFPHSPGALPFWQSIGTQVGADEAGQYPQFFFEISFEQVRDYVAGVRTVDATV
jgi:GNAT superfamily N-acetyltransferase